MGLFGFRRLCASGMIGDTPMNIGDLVTILPAGDGIYLIVEKLTQNLDKWGNPLWSLYGKDTHGCVTMSEEWMEVISK